MPYTMKFIVMVCAAFFARVKPVSTSAKPACMNITRNPATSVQTKWMATVLASISPSEVRDDSECVHNMHNFSNTLQATGHDIGPHVRRFLQYMHGYAYTVPIKGETGAGRGCSKEGRRNRGRR